MARKSWQLSRRDLIRGAGVAMALPYLNAMEGVAKAATGAAGREMPKRMLATYISYGVYMPEGPAGVPSLKDGKSDQPEWSWWPCADPGP